MRFVRSTRPICIVFAVVAVACTQSTSGDADHVTSDVTAGSDAGHEAAAAEDAGAPSFCASYCAKLHECDNQKDEQTCADACANDGAAILPKLRSDVVADLVSCVDGKDCSTVLSNDVLSACVGEAAAEVAPTSAAIAFCDAWSKSATKCGSTIDRAKCLDAVKLFSDAALANAKTCTSKTCADVAPCIEAALPISISEPSPPPPQKGIGDSCNTDADCSVGTCNGTWCTVECYGSSVTYCKGIHAGGTNEMGEYNDCVRANDGKAYCFPACESSSASCNDYAGTRCQSTTTYLGSSVYVCAQ